MSERIVAKTAAWDAESGAWTFTFAEDVTVYAGDTIVIEHPVAGDIGLTITSLDGAVVRKKLMELVEKVEVSAIAIEQAVRKLP